MFGSGAGGVAAVFAPTGLSGVTGFAVTVIPGRTRCTPFTTTRSSPFNPSVMARKPLHLFCQFSLVYVRSALCR